MARIEFRNIQKSFGEVMVIPGMDLVIEDGEFVALLGPSGCGKSTSLLMLAGIYLPSGGEMLFDGALVNEVEARDRNVGIVFQSYALYPHMSVLQNIMFPLKFKKVPEADARRRAEEVARLVQVQELLQRRPAELSGGQQQRVALARALVKRPQLLLLDEPLSNLDATVTSILVTHDQLEATTMADRIICMSRGRIEQIGTPDDLYLRPQSLFVAGFIGSPPINLLPGEIAGDRLRIDGSSLPYRGDASGPVVFGLRPEALRFEASGLAGRIAEVEPMGRETLYLVESELGTLRVLEAGSSARHGFGDAVAVAFDAEATLIFDQASERLLQGHARMPS
jgi:inositol-phosphate transport system ATP-binding protein